jgi:4-hydroxybenzoate polyprenyltransferase
MNKLSWFLYSVNLLSNIGEVATLMLVFSALFLLCTMIGYVLINIFEDEGDKDARRVRNVLTKTRNVLLLSCLIFLFPALLIPTKKTMYLILASEIGQRAYDTPENKELLQNMRSVITRELKKLGE